VAVNDQMTQERPYLYSTHLAQMPFVMKQDEAPKPVHIRLLRAGAVMLCAQMNVQLIKQLECLRCDGRHDGGINEAVMQTNPIREFLDLPKH
jgi:hypothetical protein